MTRFLWRIAITRGFFGGSRPWTAVVAVLAAVRVMRRLAGNKPETVYSGKLQPGQALLITHHADLRLGDEPR